MSDKITHTGLEVCTDCAMMIANGELGQGDEDAEREHAERMANLWPPMALVLSGEQDEEAHFSWLACDGCGSLLGGDRLAAVAFDEYRAP